MPRGVYLAWLAWAAAVGWGQPAGYVKKATPVETLNVSLEAYRASIPKTGDWYILGPFEHDDTSYDGTKSVDLNATYKGLAGAEVGWTKIWKPLNRNRRHNMNQFIKPRMATPCALYVWGTLESKGAHKLLVKIMYSNRITVWFNGKQIASRDKARHSQDRLAINLPLQDGRNELLYRIDTNPRGKQIYSTFYPARSEEDKRREFLGQIYKDFPDASVQLMDEFNHIQTQLRGDKTRRLRFRYSDEAIRAQTLRPDALVAKSDRDPLDVVLRRTAALLRDLQAITDAPDLSKEAAELKALAASRARTPVENAGERWGLFVRACKLRRRIAFKNPLLDFDRIVFLTHHRSTYSHMCDQYFGFNARAGGGLYVLEDCWSARPKVRDLLKDAKPENGRFKGRALKPGSFMSLDLSYDAKRLLFAYTEGERTRYKWSPKSTYHVFKMNADGAGLTQLTDGRWNDFDPCWMPDGRIVFVSERRGGFGRCHGRPVPTYTLHEMNADGSNIHALSLHETNEWHPSVDRNGLLCYTRWDYVDRDSDIAHHIWLTYPDGRDPRSFHGNYPKVRESRPWMEMSIRAVPGSQRYVAVAAPHHGQAYGSLVLIDHRPADDGSMSQLKRVTPDVPFPEAELPSGGQVYGSPWPLSEDYYLCVYDPNGRHYGLYLIDSFGNRELIYRDPNAPCLDPIPLRARPKPARLPRMHDDCNAASNAKATVAVVNVYESDFEWPKGTRIKALRVIQLFPKTTPKSSQPMIGAASQSLARGVLGTAPVAADGSAHFELPAHVPVYFQALDERGMAVQSMRSETYAHAGERLTCLGCHERKNRTPRHGRKMPLALRRPASKLKPDVSGSYPLLYPALVQPVIDRKCVGCHAKEKKAPDLSAADSGRYGWSQSFRVLSRYGYALHGGNGSIRRKSGGGSRSIAGSVGAHGSKLYQMLSKGHHEVKLTAEELHRITLWLDCNTNFYGDYRDCRTQSRGELVRPEVF